MYVRKSHGLCAAHLARNSIRKKLTRSWIHLAVADGTGFK